MNFKQFREAAKAAGLAVNQHEYRGKQFVFMLRDGVLALPADRESLYRLLDFADSRGYPLRKDMQDFHASIQELETEITPIVVWQPFEGTQVAHDIWNDGIMHHSTRERQREDVAPPGRIFLKDWLE